MKNNINIIQFMPYFPPHKWWVETVWEEIGKYWIKNNFWEFINVVTDFEQSPHLIFPQGREVEQVVFEWEVIWYKQKWYEVLVCPSFEIINNFPVFKFWNKKYKLIIKYLEEKTSPQFSPTGEGVEQNWRIITHTRFFLTSLIWWIFAKTNKIKWIHIEHWSDYIKLSSKIKSFLSVIYDKIIWKWIFTKSDRILAISNACKKFINKEFVNRKVNVFYRGLDLPNQIKIYEDLNEKFKWKKIIWYVGRLYKWKNVESLIKAFYKLDDSVKSSLQLVIVWDWEDFDRLKVLDVENKVYFTWIKSFEEALSYQKQFYIHIHPSSPGWWLATTLLQAMNLWCMIVATPNEWAKEVIEDNKNGFLLENDNIEEIKRGIELVINNFDKKEKFSEENKKIIEEKFKWENNIFNLYDLVR